MEKKNIQVYLSIFFLHFLFQSGALKEASGDVGAKITSGSHNITRNILEEIKELRGDKIKISS